MTWKDCAASFRNGLIASARHGFKDEALALFSGAELDEIATWWPLWAREDQMAPDQVSWRVWLILGGRGAGKTRAGAEWVRARALGLDQEGGAAARRIALVGETESDVRNVMIEGVSGILAVHGHRQRPLWEPSRRRLTWPNGAIAQVFSAEQPDQMRGPQFDSAWADEIAKWRHAEMTWDMLQMALRIGTTPRLVATTTPRPIALLKQLIADEATVTSRAATVANRAFLAAGFIEEIERRYAGTRLGRQELDGEIVEDRPGALWTRGMIEAARGAPAPALVRIVVGVDPPASNGPGGACGIIAAGLASDGRVHVLDDRTVEAARPQQWANAVVSLFHALGADRIVAEVNQGGDMVEAVIRQVDPAVPVTKVRASRGKWLRAEPVAALYEQGRVVHDRPMTVLEDQMCDFTAEGLSAGRSPDRLDALVWAVTALIGPVGRPSVRSL